MSHSICRKCATRPVNTDAGWTHIHSFFPSFFLLRVAGGGEEPLSAILPTGLIPSSSRLATRAHYLPLPGFFLV